MEPIEFRFMSGNNLGATLKLPEGLYTLGNDPNCDIKIDDNSVEPTMVNLEVAADGNVFVSCKKGLALLRREKLVQKEQMMPNDFLSIGGTALAFKTEDTAFKAITPQDLMPLTEVTSEEFTDDHQSQSEAEDTTNTQNENSVLASDDIADKVAIDTVNGKRTGLLSLCFSALGLILLLALLYMLIFCEVFSSKQKTIEDEISDIETTLHQKGFNDISVFFDDKDKHFVLEGFVADKASFEQLKDALPSTKYNLLVNVKAVSDLSAAIKRAYSIQGYFVNPIYDKGAFNVYGYIKDPYLENEAINKAALDLPFIYGIPVKADFIYKNRLSKLIDELSVKHHLSNVAFYYKDGSVVYDGNFSTKDSENFAKLEDDLLSKLKAKVHFIDAKSLDTGDIELLKRNLANDNNATLETLKKDKENKNQEIEIAAKDDFELSDIMGVTMKPMHFVTLKNGAKFFEGAVLPNGYTLEKIDVNKLTLSKGGQRVIYELK